MATTLFPTIDAAAHDITEGFQFHVLPADDTLEDDIEACAEAQDILNDNWDRDSGSHLEVSDLLNADTEDGDLLYLMSVQLLEEHGFADANNLVITSVVVIGDLAVVQCTFSDLESMSDESVTANESDFD